MAGVEVDHKEYLRIVAAQVSPEEHQEIQAAVASRDKAIARAAAIHQINKQEESNTPTMLRKKLIDLVDGNDCKDRNSQQTALGHYKGGLTEVRQELNLRS